MALREHEIGCPFEGGNVPSSPGSTGIAANSAVDFAWSAVQQKVVVQNDTGATIYVVVGGTGASPTHSAALSVAAGQALVMGHHRPHLVQHLSIYSVAAAIFSGAGKNLTVVGWAA